MSHRKFLVENLHIIQQYFHKWKDQSSYKRTTCIDIFDENRFIAKVGH